MRIINRHTGKEYLVTTSEWEVMKKVKKSQRFNVLNWDENVIMKSPVPKEIVEFQAIKRPTKIEPSESVVVPEIKRIEKTKQSKKGKK